MMMIKDKTNRVTIVCVWSRGRNRS